MLTPDDPVKTEHLGHLGLVASTIERLGLVDKINKRLPLDYSKGGKISHGHRTAAMILNGLGYLTRTLYLSSHFFEDKPLDLLLGIDVEAHDINDDMLGRHLDAIADYGTTKLFSEIAFEICLENNLLGQSYHLDTTSMTLYGDYEEYPNASPLPLRGYSKGHRPDLKQVTLSLTQVGDSNMPLWMEALDGNASDRKTFQETVKAIQRFQQSISSAQDNLFFVVDAAFYTPEKLRELSQVQWITRVPANYKEAKKLLTTPSQALSWQAVDEENSIHVSKGEYHGLSQRWIVVRSKQAKKRALKTFYKRLEKQSQEHHQTLWHLCNQTFNCQADAEKALQAFEKKLRYHMVNYEIVPLMKFSGKGRPKRGEVPACVGYCLQASLASDVESIRHEIDCLGRFILATNDRDGDFIEDKAILSEYKSQTQVEGGFLFLKRDEFELNHVFLKDPNRIGALMMVMTLCLVTYNFAQHKLRETLKAQNIVLPNQLGKPIKNPTMRWIFQLMSKITVLCLWDEVSGRWVKRVCNVKTLHQVIAHQFGLHAKQIYGIPINTSLPQYDKNQKSLHLWCGM